MSRYRVTVTDVLHIRRTATLTIILAKDEDEAEERALYYVADNAHKLEWDEEQLDADPYTVEEITEIFPHTPDKCPSKHWNRGDDICADCGENLN